MPDEHHSIKVFLCHAHSDRTAARDLYIRLRSNGVDAWLDKESLLPGQDWEYEIRKAVRKSAAVVVCLSRQFNEAGFRQKEVRLALDTAMEKPEGEIFIIPVRLEECDVPGSLSRLHWVDLFEEDGYDRLLAALRQRANPAGAPPSENKPDRTRRGELKTPDDAAVSRNVSKRTEKKQASGLFRRVAPWLVLIAAIAILLSGARQVFLGLISTTEATPTTDPTTITPGTGTPCADEPPETSLEFSQIVTHSICPAGDTDIFRFSGASGERVRIQVTWLKGNMRPCIELIAPDATSSVACENAFNNVIDVTLDQTGTYTIVVDVWFLGAGDYNLVVERL